MGKLVSTRYGDVQYHSTPRALADQGSAKSDANLLRTTDWSNAFSGRNAEEIQPVITAAFTVFIDLLFTFVGADLGFRLLQQIWPELPGTEPRMPIGDDLR